MTDSTLALFVLFSSVVEAPGATIDCNTGCPVETSTYNITCAGNSSGNCVWHNGSTKVMSCGKDGSCSAEVSGYQGYIINNSYYVLEILDLSTSTINCTLGKSHTSCQVITVQELEVPTGKLNATCFSDEVGCSGLTSHGTPPVTLELKNGDTVLASTTTEGHVTSQRKTTASETYTCGVTGAGAKCVSPVEITCAGHAPTSQPDHATTAQPGKESLIIGISAGVGGVVLLIILITAICCYRKRAKQGDDKEHISKLAAKDKKREVNSNVYASPNALPAREKAVMCDNVVYESSGDTRDSGEAVFQDNVLYGRK